MHRLVVGGRAQEALHFVERPTEQLCDKGRDMIKLRTRLRAREPTHIEVVQGHRLLMRRRRGHSR